ncbi:DUF397 domain-containing protein [Streptomyces sp. MJP52]|uniref:DUF397 domain-containing protein n=1 Tax=Streptomyces sp. MJP52 TaxID=2940555 RepID=UPI002474CE45|nr:DUF397 domain-containing protein [Streptomyces sp. MJP52]MDH6226806.1 hypothetical protein [Streptomyces sp. MJP52]
MTAPIARQWFKSSYSGGSGTECVECACSAESALIRDSKQKAGPVIRVTPQAWSAFVHALGQPNRKF